MPNIEYLDLSNPKNVKFKDLVLYCTHFFGEPRINGSHHIYPTPWIGDPYVNIQHDKNNKKMAVAYQVRQIRRAIEKLHEMEGEK